MKSIEGHLTLSPYPNTILGIAAATSKIRSWDHDIQNPLEQPVQEQVQPPKSIFDLISLSPTPCLFGTNQAQYQSQQTAVDISCSHMYQQSFDIFRIF